MPVGAGRLAAAALAAIAIAAAVLLSSISMAHVIYVYQANVNFAAQTPVVWLAGPNAGQVRLTLTNKSNPLVTLTIPATNATEIYVYQALELKVNTAFYTSTPYLYVDYCSYAGSLSIKNVTILVYPTSGSPYSPTGKIVLYPSTTGCTFSGSVALSQGTTYYLDFQVFPALPVPHASAGTNIGTLTVYFDIGNGTTTTVPLP